MREIPRIHPSDARIKVLRGDALLVCGYDDEAKFEAMKLDGAISLGAFRAMEPMLDRGREIVFYCA
jgi:hypothetical protein